MSAMHSNSHREPPDPFFNDLAPHMCPDRNPPSGELIRSLDGELSQLTLREGEGGPERLGATNQASVPAPSLLPIAMTPQQFNTEV